MSIATEVPQREIQWLRSQQYDMALIVGVLFIGVFAALLAVAQPALLWPIIIVNLWLFGYHHVVATYTRLCFDKESFKRSRFLIFGLAPIGRPMGHLHDLFLLAMVALFETKLGCIPSVPR